jgi:hypothetical protein
MSLHCRQCGRETSRVTENGAFCDAQCEAAFARRS